MWMDPEVGREALGFFIAPEQEQSGAEKHFAGACAEKCGSVQYVPDK